MTDFTKEQLNLINEIKKTLGSDFIWKYLEILRIENELGHFPSIQELVSNAGETTYGSWCIAVGSLKEAGFIQKKSKVQTMEDLLFESNLLDILWKCVKPFLSEDGFETYEHKTKAQTSVHMFCDTKAKASPERADMIKKCEEKIMENIEQMWDSKFNHLALNEES